jgi:hypothetical protein
MELVKKGFNMTTLQANSNRYEYVIFTFDSKGKDNATELKELLTYNKTDHNTLQGYYNGGIEYSVLVNYTDFNILYKDKVFGEYDQDCVLLLERINIKNTRPAYMLDKKNNTSFVGYLQSVDKSNLRDGENYSKSCKTGIIYAIR